MQQSQGPQIDVVVRCANKMPYVESTLERLLHQRGCAPRIAFFDCGSTDGSRKAAERFKVRMVDIGRAISSPGAMMNHAMRVTSSQVVVFVDADAIPLSDDSLATLVDAFAGSATLAAAFGRQIARRSRRIQPSRESLGRSTPLDASFSMAASAVHRSAWHRQAFDERLRYAEDIEWMTRVRRDGWTTKYVAEAPFEQSQDATLRGHFARASAGNLLKDAGTGLSASRSVPITLGPSSRFPSAAVRIRT